MGIRSRAMVGWGALACAAVLVAGCSAADRVGDARQSVIGGESSEPGSYPATGALLHGLAYRCTATLIAPDVAITAAHCLAEGGFGDFGFTLDADLGDGMGHPIEVLAHHQHPAFQEDGEELQEIGQRNDVGVVILAEPIEGVAVEELDLGLDPAGDDSALITGSTLTLCGYGRDEWAAPSTGGVKRDGVVYVDRMGDWELQTTDEDPQPCRGDSGAPLFAEGPDGRRIAALVSRATGDSHKCDSGGIHTRVAPYADWIAEAARDRDTGGCKAGGGRAGGAGAVLVLAACLLAAAGGRRRRAALITAVVAAALAGCGASGPAPVGGEGGSAGRALQGPFGVRGTRLSDGERVRLASGRLADFEAGTVASGAASWHLITDRMMEGHSAVTMRRIPGGAHRTGTSLEVRGEIRRGYQLPFAGVILYPGAQPMQPVDLSGHRELVLWTRGDGRRYQVVLLSRAGGRSPPRVDFVASAEWSELRLRLADFRGADLSHVTGVMIGAGPPMGAFRLALDEVELR
jgi:hypothetical protein